MVSLSIPSCWTIAWFVTCRPMASSMMTCTLSRTLWRRSPTSGATGLGSLLRKKLMDQVVISPRTAERTISIYGVAPSA
ncbi:hypothetical protein PVAP13_5KG232407 [Panicum virgatum]|uniref:Secreted protein n=1 Tax=Panicum virgatum TaxID=38727 RepID=A0A8T0SMT0_PANVG|nr:hypothetical protein PVAP13_5KG232407 [Panicum virgatum]